VGFAYGALINLQQITGEDQAVNVEETKNENL